MLCSSWREHFILFKATFCFFCGKVTFLDKKFAEDTEIAFIDQKLAEELLVL